MCINTGRQLHLSLSMHFFMLLWTCACPRVCFPPKSFARICACDRGERILLVREAHVSLLLEGKIKGEEKQLFASLLILWAFSFRLRAVWLSYRENNLIRKGLECTFVPLIERLHPELVSRLYSPADQATVVIKGKAAWQKAAKKKAKLSATNVWETERGQALGTATASPLWRTSYGQMKQRRTARPSESRNFLYHFPPCSNGNCSNPGKKPETRVAKSGPNVLRNSELSPVYVWSSRSSHLKDWRLRKKELRKRNSQIVYWDFVGRLLICIFLSYSLGKERTLWMKSFYILQETKTEAAATFDVQPFIK